MSKNNQCQKTKSVRKYRSEEEIARLMEGYYAVLAEGRSATDYAKKVNVPLSTIIHWKKRGAGNFNGDRPKAVLVDRPSVVKARAESTKQSSVRIEINGYVLVFNDAGLEVRVKDGQMVKVVSE